MKRRQTTKDKRPLKKPRTMPNEAATVQLNAEIQIQGQKKFMSSNEMAPAGFFVTAPSVTASAYDKSIVTKSKQEWAIYREESPTQGSIKRSYFACTPATFVEKIFGFKGNTSALQTHAMFHHEHIDSTKHIRLIIDLEHEPTISWNQFYSFAQFVKRSCCELIQHIFGEQIGSSDWIELDASDFYSKYSMHMTLHSIYFKNLNSLKCFIHALVIAMMNQLKNDDIIIEKLSDGTPLLTGISCKKMLFGNTFDIGIYKDFGSLRTYFSQKELLIEDRRLVRVNTDIAMSLYRSSILHSKELFDDAYQQLKSIKTAEFDRDTLRKTLFHYIEASLPKIQVLQIDHTQYGAMLESTAQSMLQISTPTSNKSNETFQIQKIETPRILYSTAIPPVCSISNMITAIRLEEHHAQLSAIDVQALLKMLEQVVLFNITVPASRYVVTNIYNEEELQSATCTVAPDYSQRKNLYYRDIKFKVNASTSSIFLAIEAQGFCGIARRYHQSNRQWFMINLLQLSCKQFCFDCKKQSITYAIPTSLQFHLMFIANEIQYSKHPAKSPKPLDINQNPYAFLQNDAGIPVVIGEYGPTKWSTVLHYIANRIVCLESDRKQIELVHSALEVIPIVNAAIANGKAISVQEWAQIKENIFYSALKQKCEQHCSIQRLLMSTRGFSLVDSFYSQHPALEIMRPYLIDMGMVCMKYRDSLFQ